MSSFVPAPEGTRFRIVSFPPDAELGRALYGLDLAAVRQQLAAKLPGLGDSHETEDPGMHTTDTMDYDIVLSGEITLELDDGAVVHLKQGDCVVQNGTRHAWRNRSSAPCVMACVMVGARRC
jgi:mannose-6-phosphate isomerase-like protein (cupin superfamily)